MSGTRLTKQEADVIRTMYHGLSAKPIKEAAQYLGVSADAVRKLLCSAFRKVPQLCPLLTKQQYEVLYMLREGMDVFEISEGLDISCDAARMRISRLRRKGALDKYVPTGKTVRFNENTMSGKVRMKW